MGFSYQEKVMLEAYQLTVKELYKQIKGINQDILNILEKNIQNHKITTAIKEKSYCRNCKLVSILVKDKLCFRCFEE